MRRTLLGVYFITGLGVLVPSLPVHADITVALPTRLTASVAGGPDGPPISDNVQTGSNGRHIVFQSDATDLVSGDTNLNLDVFIRDMTTSAVGRMSVSTSGAEADSFSARATVSSITPNGFYAAAFQSTASNIGSISLPPSSFNSIFVRMPTLGITEIISAGVGFTQPSGPSINPSIAVVPVGNNHKVLVTYSSAASNLVSGDSPSFEDIFLTTFTAPSSTSYNPTTLLTTIRLSNSGGGGSDPDGNSETPKISADGKYVVFASSATNLISGQVITIKQVYRINVETLQLDLISKTPQGDPGGAQSYSPVISYTGRYVAYLTDATDIVPNSVINNPSAVWYDTVTGTSTRINMSDAGVVGDSQPQAISISANGRFVSFNDDSTNLISSDTNGETDVYVKDMLNGDIARVSAGPNGAEGDAGCNDPGIAGTLNSLSPKVYFSTQATTLVSPAPVGSTDVYVSTVTFPPPPFVPGSTTLELPPDVQIGTKKIKFFAQKFEGIGSSATAAASTGAAQTAIRYDFAVRRTGKVKGKKIDERTRVVTKRNNLTLIKAKGKYTVRNRVVTVNPSNNKVISKTPFSPRATFKVP